MENLLCPLISFPKDIQPNSVMPNVPEYVEITLTIFRRASMLNKFKEVLLFLYCHKSLLRKKKKKKSKLISFCFPD